MQTIHIGVLSASDRASKGIYEDLSGKAIQEVLSEYLLNPLEFHYEIVADERDLKPPKQKSQISLVFGMNALVPLGTI